MKHAYGNAFYGQSIFMPFKQPAIEPVEGKEVIDIQNPMYVNVLGMRGHNSGFFELKRVKMNEKETEFADI